MNDSLNNETPVITVAAIDSQAAETNIGQTINDVKFILNRTGNTSAALTVNYTLSGSAIDGLDYSPLTGRVIFAAGSSTALINIAPINDTLAEFNETVILTLGTGTGYNLGAVNTSTVTLLDNETPVIIDAGNTLATATNIGGFTGTRTFNNAIGGNDPSDYYKLTLSAKSKLDVLLGGMSGNADFQRAMDGN